MKWFKHDSNASTDAKIEHLILKYGVQGYGLYFYCLELIARSVEKHNLTFELEHDAKIIAHRVLLSPELVEEMMRYMVDLGLFENDRGIITCLKMATRADEYTQKLIKSRQYPDGVPTKSELREEKEQNKIDKKESTNMSSPKVSDQVPFKKIIDLYHEMLPALPKVEKLTTTRKGYIRQRFIEDLPDLENWENYFDYVSQSDFLMGRTQPTNGRPPFRASLEWLTKPANYAKVAEENYHGV